ncbi:LacI family DNA-binding transcriptional regulator [Fulvimarina sp. 2208YS6-2-32]|uniref:LacI family DNA-binding transcriptional regulator n=1 Tax=Fulvimarina uroteuthidis TaxID=3098149 RepID=A0ABU5I7E5_9HYPH|nr:LacI family DNA-binding transcriptional regulator [Fulvimarina sp. 2208YS6-2-32]MDY8111042.1 LacI family DNA-binding transcriptional regulator [Fulvimarina sp. 2208YS6-2-32]
MTIRDVAAAAEVSVATASRAINGTGRMADETRVRVREAALSIGYRPNMMARGLVQKRSFTIGLVTNDTYGRFTLPVAAGLSQAMHDRGVSVFLASTQDNPALELRTFEAMEEKCVDGLVVANRRVDRGLTLPETVKSIPTVYVMSACPDGAIGFNPDDVGAARAATEHLLSIGRTRIAHITGPKDFAAARYREEGWRAALAEAGLSAPAPAIYGTWSEAHGWDMAQQLLTTAAPDKRPDAVFCGNDQIARGFIDGATRLGVGIPGDVAIVGFDNWEIFAAATRPPLTTMDMGLLDLGRSAGLSLLDIVDGKRVEPGLRHQPYRIVIRGSCGTAKTAGTA